jgi:Uma2 family endonuclease
MTVSAIDRSVSRGQPAWDIARLYPDQGAWSDGDYLDFTRDTRHLVEFTDGCIEVLPMPKMSHQRILRFLHQLLFAFVVARRSGEVLFAPLRVRMRDGKYREPDIVFMKTEHAARMSEEFWDGADLVIEVISDDNRERDLVTKRADYAEAQIPEYWIVDPQSERITVLRLQGNEYVVHGEFAPGQQATSVLLSGFSASVSEVFQAAKC